jgi:hypothetical protein
VLAQLLEQAGDEHDVAVEPQHAAGRGQSERLEEAFGGVRLVVQLVVDER